MIEIVVVLAITTVMAGMAAYSYTTMAGVSRVRADTRTLVTALNRAKSQAASTGGWAGVQINVSDPQGQYVMTFTDSLTEAPVSSATDITNCTASPIAACCYGTGYAAPSSAALVQTDGFYLTQTGQQTAATALRRPADVTTTSTTPMDLTTPPGTGSFRIVFDSLLRPFVCTGSTDGGVNVQLTPYNFGSNSNRFDLVMADPMNPTTYSQIILYSDGDVRVP